MLPQITTVRRATEALSAACSHHWFGRQKSRLDADRGCATVHGLLAERDHSITAR